jgi:hypothetical protein
MANSNPFSIFTKKEVLLAEEFSALLTVNINSKKFKSKAKEIVQDYFRTTGPYLKELGVDKDLLVDLENQLQTLNILASANNAKATYKSCLKLIKNSIVKLEIIVATLDGARRRNADADANIILLNKTEGAIISILDSLIPSSALSYRQAIADLNQNERSSYRGVAAELRESLRELLDHMAPDNEVIKVPGFKFEPNTQKPTQRQKTKFILDSRKISKTAQKAPLVTLAALEEIISALARSTYERASLSTHVSTSKQEVVQFKRYLDVVLCELLQIT